MKRLDILEGLKGKFKNYGLENNLDRSFIEDELECELYNDVVILRNDRFEVKYVKRSDEVELSTTYSNIKIDDSFRRELNNLVIDVNVANIQLNNLKEEEIEESNKKVEKQIEEQNEMLEENKKEEMTKGEEKDFENLFKNAQIKMSKNMNYKKIFDNGLRTRKIYYTKNEIGIEFKNVIHVSLLGMIEDFINRNNSCRSNLVFINKDNELEKRLYKNNQDYTFTEIK
ncbi:MAG: hypothetical protein ACFFG0_38610 [Candidatus Thorarchaeota archaeon]